MTYTQSFEIGATVPGTNLAALATPVNYPKTAFHPYAATVDLDDLTQRGMGLPSVVWHWAIIPQDQRDMLRAFCPGASASVFIRTRTNDTSAIFKYYSAEMVWPSLAEDYDARHRQAFDILFRNMVLQADPGA